MGYEPLPLPLFIILITALILWPIGTKVIRKFRKHESDSPHHFIPAESPFKLIGWALQDPLTLRRLAITLLLATGIAFLQRIPLPGLATSDFSYLGITSGYPLISLFNLNILPFLSACIYIQVASLFIPPLRRWLFDSSQYHKLAGATLLLTVSIVLLQTVPMAIGLEYQELIAPGFKLLTVISLTAALAFLLVIARFIQSWGIGNGIAICFVALSMPSLLTACRKTPIMIPVAVIVFLFAFRLAYRTPYCTLTTNSVPLQLPLRRTFLGITPWYLTSFTLFIPATLYQFYPSEFLKTFYEVINYGWPNIAFSLVLLIVFVFAYKGVVYKPDIVTHWLHHYGFEVGTHSEQSLNRALNRMLIQTIAFLLVAAHLPSLLSGNNGIPFAASSLLASWPMVILGGVAADIVSQFQYYRERSISGIENWVQWAVAGDDMEAAIIQGYLRSHEIPALVEPLRFSWRLPARTMVERHIIYIPESHLQRAAELSKTRPE